MKRKRLVRLIIVGMCLFAFSACTTGAVKRSETPTGVSDDRAASQGEVSEGAAAETVRVPKDENVRQMWDRIDKAYQEAQKTGKKTVNVYLEEDPDTVQVGDYVHVHYTALLEDGTLFRTTRPAVANDESVKRAAGFEMPEEFGPEEVVPGAGNVVPGLGDAVLGMSVGQQRAVTIPAEDAFGVRDPEKTEEIPRTKRMPRVLRVRPETFVKRFKRFPKEGQEMPLDPYFNARVTEVSEADAVLELLPKEGYHLEEAFGATDIVLDEEKDAFVVTVTPDVGAPFGKGNGRVTSFDEETFTVDYNHPLADKEIHLDVAVVSLTKASALAQGEIPWHNDYNEGLDEARREAKPVVLVLYADWCKWCKRLMDQTIEDPRVKKLKDRFVWIKVNSDKEKKYHALFQQKGFPMTVLMDAEGVVQQKINGYKRGFAFQQALEAVLNPDSAGPLYSGKSQIHRPKN